MYLVFTRIPIGLPLVEFLYLVFTRIPVGLALVEFMYLVFTRMQGESYRRPLSLLLCLCDVFSALVC